MDRFGFRRGLSRRQCLAVAAGAALAILLGYLFYLIGSTPDKDDLRRARIAQPSILLASDGTELARLQENRQEPVRLSQISPHVIHALIATEDHRFFDHGGVDLRRTAAALFFTLTGDAQGGSTLTQQLARNLFPEEIGRSRSLDRKLREAITALKIESAWSKQQILETYLNTVPFLYNTYGIEMAARTYFDKTAAELGPLEAATLIGMLKGTHYYNPIVNPERAQARRNVVLGQMMRRGFLTEAERVALVEEPLEVGFHREPDTNQVAPHFVAHVRRFLAEWADKNDYDLASDGLIIETTLHPGLQKIANEAVKEEADVLQRIADVEWGLSSSHVHSTSAEGYASLHKRVTPFAQFWRSRPDLEATFIAESAAFRKLRKQGKSAAEAADTLRQDARFMAALKTGKTRLEAGFVAIEPGSGEVLAWVGSRDFRLDQFDHVGQAQRQPGSTFKPIVYGAALERGMTSDRLYYDRPIRVRMSDGTEWRPTDMSGSSGRAMTLRQGLVYSKNTITAQLVQEVGVSGILGLARAVGVEQSRLDPVLSIGLGTSPVTLLEMATAYATIANLGEYRQPVVVRRIRTRDGVVLAEFIPHYRMALTQDSAIELIDMMRGVVRKGTGTSIRTRYGVTADVAGKTGTTQRNTDGWFLLMHPRLVAGAWVGFNDQRVTMRTDYWGQGGHNAIRLVGAFFREALQNPRIEASAVFPTPERPPRIYIPRYGGGHRTEDEWVEDEEAYGEEPMEQAAPHQEASLTPALDIIRVNGGEIRIERAAGTGSTGSAAGITGSSIGAASPNREPPRSAEELARVMNGMGRDPNTGVPVRIGTP